jgi:hypothetical protein
MGDEKETDEIGKKLDLADGWLTKFGNILKKHWGKLLLIVACYGIYFICTHPDNFKQQKPEIIVIVADSLQADSIESMDPDSLVMDTIDDIKQ